MEESVMNSNIVLSVLFNVWDVVFFEFLLLTLTSSAIQFNSFDIPFVGISNIFDILITQEIFIDNSLYWSLFA